MSLALTLMCLWVVAASIAGLLPSKRSHWPAAYGLIVTGLPLLGYVIYTHGPWIGILCGAAGASILRWPVIYLARWVQGRLS